MPDYLDYPSNKIHSVTGQYPETNVTKIQKYVPTNVYQSGVQQYLENLGIYNLVVVDPISYTPVGTGPVLSWMVEQGKLMASHRAGLRHLDSVRMGHQWRDQQEKQALGLSVSGEKTLLEPQGSPTSWAPIL
eukprot:11739702-Karenia_brevis.AAC.1